MRGRNKLVRGVGVNDADYPVYKTENGKIVWQCTYYRTWNNMLARAYCDKYKQKYRLMKVSQFAKNGIHL